MEQISFLNTRFDRMTPHETVARLLDRALSRRGGRIYFANAHTMVTAFKMPALVDALKRSDMLLADGSGVLWGSKILGEPLIHNLNGTDLVPALASAGKAHGLSVYLFGAAPGVAEAAAANLRRDYPGITIAGTQDGYFAPEEMDTVLDTIRAARPHILLVALGVPLQELWIHNYADQLSGITCIGVGGLFDFLAKRVPRAPKIVRAIGMEWTWRLAMEPRRLWQRYVNGNLAFLLLLAAQAIAPRPPKPFALYRTETEDAERAVGTPYKP
jgi:N-acetylglucosaminyldiphosphoundecaprenol N-acetyl-beta-D-mannosaminyltransferase